MARTPWPALVVAIAGALVLRLVDLERVPAWYTDEGLWSMPARDFVLFGNWFASFDSHYLLSPLYSVILAATFELLGPGIVQARMLNVLLGTATVGMVFLVGRRMGFPMAGAFAAVTVAFDGPSTVTSRSAILENLQTLLLLGCVFFTVGSGRWRPIAVAGCLCLAILTKPLSLYAVPAIVAYVWMRSGFREAALEGAVVAAGAVLAGAIFAGLALSNGPVFSAAWARETSIRGLQWLPRGYEDTLVLSTQYALTRAPILLLALATTAVWMWRQKIRDREIHFLGCWVVVGVVAMSVQGYSPSRYYVPLFPVAWLAVYLVIQRVVRAPLASRVSSGLFGIHALFSVASLFGYYYVLGRPDADSALTTHWLNEHVASDEAILGPHRLLVGTRNRAVAQQIYGDEHVTADELKALGVSVVVTAPDTNLASGRPSILESQPERYRQLAEFGQVRVYKLDP